MKHALLCLSVLFAPPLHAESLCGVSDVDFILDQIEGRWAADGNVSVESETLSVFKPLPDVVVIGPDHRLTTRMTRNMGLTPELDVAAAPYDVDAVDDMLDTVEAAWIADAVSDTPCGPEELTQLSAEVRVDDVITGHVTLIPYFTDRVVLIAEVETRGDWGLAFVTHGLLLTRADEPE
ncbi:hypothetical protein [Thalassorhabdomicrobium marinisediminis]|uniref:hypothetical protein n=1 Tax=Thalassorhabdomicrobium marinisediminis TaxID=2170577 RepID=UPI002492F059|nr:hypothetical protein [Thalassorhabdomicrobium marinisediminis]